MKIAQKLNSVRTSVRNFREVRKTAKKTTTIVESEFAKMLLSKDIPAKQ